MTGFPEKTVEIAERYHSDAGAKTKSLEGKKYARSNLYKTDFKNTGMELSLLRIPENKKKALELFVKTLKEKYDNKIHRIILFGSTARGEAGEESDIDVLVVADGVNQKEISKIAFQVFLKYGEVVSPIVEDGQQFEKYKDYSFHRNVLKEGVEIG